MNDTYYVVIKKDENEQFKYLSDQIRAAADEESRKRVIKRLYQNYRK